MFAWGHWLTLLELIPSLLIPVFCLCGATEYYVRPTEPTNTSCPAQPCLTLSQYIIDFDHYFQSNAVFKFLPGTHLMKMPIVLEHLHNISWTRSESSSNNIPNLVAGFPCDQAYDCVFAIISINQYDCCAAIHLYNSHNLMFEKISLTVKTPGMSAVIGRHVSNVFISLKTTCPTRTSLKDPSGILMSEANLVQVHTSDVSNCSYGLVLSTTTNVTIANTHIVNSGLKGMYLVSTNNTAIVNTNVMYSGNVGVHLQHATSTSIINATVSKQWNGMYLVSATNTTISNFFAMHSGSTGMVFTHAINTTIINATAQHNNDGISLVSTVCTSITNPHALYNNNDGIGLVDTITTNIINPTLLHNGDSGIYLDNATSTTITNLTALYNTFAGTYLMSSTNTSIINPRIMHNEEGITMKYSIDIRILNPHISYNNDGIYLAESSKIIIVNLSLIHNKHDYGMSVYHTTNVMLINPTVMYSGDSGIILFNTDNTTIVNPTVLYNSNSGIFMELTKNTFIINSVLLHNKAHGLHISEANITTVLNPTIQYNGEYGVMLLGAHDTNISNASVMLNGWNFNIPAINGDFIIESSFHTTIHNSSFANISTAASAMSIATPTSLPAVIVLYSTSLHINGCNFTGNKITAIKAFASNITCGDLIFSSNRAIAGSAFVLLEDSILKLTEKSHIYFENNYATDIGGVFYIARNVHYKVYDEAHHDAGNVHPPKTIVLQTTCFLNTEGGRSESRLTFVNNSARNGGDILYGGNVLSGVDGDWNCLLSFKNISNISQTGLSLITSDPSRVCLCNRSGQPDCLIIADPTPHSIYPGQSINISAVVVGQDFGTVAGSVYAQFLQKSATDRLQLSDTWQNVQGVSQEVCNDLTYIIFSPTNVTETVLVLTANIRNNITQFHANKEDTSVEWNNVYKTTAVEPLEYSNYPIYINITFLPCPAGFVLKSAPPFKCDCDQLLQMIGVKCYIQDLTIGRNDLVWVGTLNNDNGTIVGSEYCMFDYCKKGDINVTLSDPDSQCNYNHSGTLCGGCQPGLSLALGNAQCLPCSNEYLALLIPFALAGPALVLFIKVLDLTICQGTINGLIFYANVVKANEYISLPQRQTNPLTLFIAWLNLDLGVETCFFHGLTAYTKTWLQFVFPLYIWSIAGLIVILAKYSGRVAKVMGNNTVPVLATLFLLSYAKLLRTIISSLSYTILYSSQGQKAVWSADGNVDYLGPKHIPLFIVSGAILLFLLLPYTLLLFLGQWLHRCNCRLIGCPLIETFSNAHYDALKSKHRYWFGVLLIVTVAILLISALTPANHGNTINLCISVFTVLLNYFGLIVYRSTAVALYNISFFMNIALLGMASFFTSIAGGDQTVAAYALIGIAFVQFLGLIFFKVFFIFKRIEKVKACLHKEEPAEDDWELYEEAALMREMESDAEDEDSDGSSSVESLPTY